jgi:GxxExxY protein
MDINDLTRKVIGCAYKVHNVLGPGFLEKVYENSLTLELKSCELMFASKSTFLSGTTVSESVCTFRISG